MFQYLFFCCQEKQKDQPNTVTLEDVISLNQKNNENRNNTTTANNNQNNIEESFINNNNEMENKQFYQNGVLLSNKGLFVNENTLYNNTNPTAPILTINNINNININLQRNSFSKEPTKTLEKKDSKSEEGNKNNLNDMQKTIVSGDNSRDQMQNKSFISFSNLTIKYNNNNNLGGSSINFSDTEIMSSCELTLIGDLFFNKEIKVDRSGIKNPLITNTNRYKNKNKKACELKLGVPINSSKISSSSIVNKNNVEEKNVNINDNKRNSISNKNNKYFSVKNNQKKKIQNMCSISSLSNSIINKNNNIDIILNLSYSKLQKRINEYSNNNNTSENIILFTLRYDTTLDMFQLVSIQDSIPVELLLNYNYPLRFQQNYNILIGSIKLKLKVIKNEKNESILNISVLNSEENNENKNGEEKKDVIYKFNPFIEKMPITIGRINCDINLNNISVSKLHAQIDYIYDYDEYFITDCQSTNGTYLLLKNTLNSIYIKREHHFKLFESKFKIQYVNFDN